MSEITYKSEIPAIPSQTAEERLKMSLPKTAPKLSDVDTLKLTSELQVHQIELELQNEELMLAKSTAQAVAEKYTQLYDFAPLGYFTLSRDGEIIELNLRGAQMLGKDRQSLKNIHLGVFVSDDTKPIFSDFLEKVFSGKPKESCEVTLSNNYDLPMYAQLSAVINENAEQCLLIATDITEHKKTQERQILYIYILNLINKKGEYLDLIKVIMMTIKEYTKFDAVAIRLKEGEDYPYYFTSGFSDDFVKVERYLCEHDKEGLPVKDENGNVHLECMCSNILCGRIDTQKPFFTKAGSFWTNRTSRLLAATNEKEKLTRTRNRCHTEGYESVAIIPIKEGDEIVGSLQFNDKRTDRFTLDFVEFFEKVCISIGIAVSKLKRDKALMDSEARYKALFNGAPEGIIVADKQTKHFSYANSAICRMFGYTEEEILLLSVSDLHPKEAVKDVLAGFEAQAKGEKYLLPNSPCIRKDGTLFYANISAARTVISGREHLIGFFTDTTERMKMQEEIDKLNSNFLSFLKNTGDFVYFKDFNSNILFCSQTLADITGHASWRDMIGKNDMEIFPKDTAQIYYEEELPIFRDGIPLINKINPFYYQSGKKGFVSTSKWPSFNKEGKIIGLLGISRDVTEQQLKEEEIRERTKELKCVYSVSELIQEEDNIEQICQRIVELMPGGWIHSEIACARITFEGRQYKTENFRETPWRQFVRISESRLSEEVLEVCYLEERPARDEGPFLKEERNLLNLIAFKLRLKIEKIRLKESLRKSLDNMIKAQAIAKVGSWELEIKNGLISSTDEFCRIFGILPGEVWTYRDFMSFVHPEDLNTVKYALDESLANTKPYSVEHRIVLPDGRIRYIQARGKVSVDINNAPVKVAGTIQDITERKVFENVLRNSEERFKAIAITAQDAVLMMDNNGLITFWNNAAEKIFGYTKEEAVGKKLHEFITPKRFMEAHMKAFPEFKRTGKGAAIGKTMELSAIRKNGEEFPVELSLSSVKIKEQWHSVGLLRDISERKRLETELLAAKDLALSASKAKSEFIANMNHELRTPLNSILGFPQVLLRENYGKLNEHQKECIQSIFISGEHLLSLINSILDIASIESGKMELIISSLSLNSIVQKMKLMFGEKAITHSINLEFKIAADLPLEFEGDDLKISQVLVNLLSNAFKFTPNGGTILFEAVTQSTNIMMISITDSGPGISKEKIIKLFTPFERLESKTEGIGLGLALSKRIVELWDGKIAVVSPPEGRETGCRFYFTIPLKQIIN